MYSRESTSSIRLTGFAGLLAALLFIPVVAEYGPIPLAVLTLLICTGMVAGTFSNNRLFYLLLLFTLILPSERAKLSFFPLSTNPKINLLLISLISCVFLYQAWFRGRKLALGKHHVIMFIGVAGIAACNSIFSGIHYRDVIYVFAPYLLFFSYYIFYDLFSSFEIKKENRNIILLLAYSLFIMLALTMLRFQLGEVRTMTHRVITSYSWVFPIVFPFSIFFMYRSGSTGFRILCAGLLFAVVYIVVLSQSRTIWAVAFFQAVLLALFYLFTDNAGKGKFTRKAGILLAVSMVIIVLISLFFFSNIDLMNRLKTLSPSHILWDPAIRHRFISSGTVLNELNASVKNWILGFGMGESISYHVFQRRYNVIWVDNSYLNLLWHTGLAGFLAYFFILVHQFRNGIRLFRHQENLQKTIGMIVIIFSLGFLLFGASNSLFTRSKYNLIWCAIWAYSDVMVGRLIPAERISEKSKGNLI